MTWTEIPLDGRTDLWVFPRGGITAAIHRSDILEHIVRQHASAFGDGFILMQDNAPAHIAQVSMTFIDDTDISVMNWPARSPNLNPTEHALGIIFRRILQRPRHPENVQNLIDALVQELQTISQKGIRSMPHRCQACVDDKGGRTSYW